MLYNSGSDLAMVMFKQRSGLMLYNSGSDLATSCLSKGQGFLVFFF